MREVASYVEQSWSVERSVTDGMILNLTFLQTKLFSRRESNIDLELLYVGLTNDSSAEKCL